MTSTKYEISDTAYLTIVMHLAKYTSAVSGLLLGTSSDASSVTVDQALPIAHSSLAIGTTPIAETALLLAEQRAIIQNQKIVGVYFGNEIADDVSIGTIPTQLAERVRSHFAHSCLLMVDGPSLAMDVRRKEHCFRLSVRSKGEAGTWGNVRPKEDVAVSENSLTVADRLLCGKGCVYDVSDFEDHCLDPRRDWYNSGIEKSWPSKQKTL